MLAVFVPGVAPPAAPPPGPPGGVPAAVAKCLTIRDDGLRLRCYDAALGFRRAAAHVIGRWSGTGDQTTLPFHADGPWELHEQVNVGYLGVDIYTKSAKLVAIAGGQGPTDSTGWSGTTYVPNGGDFYLSIGGRGTWGIEALALPPTGSSAGGSPGRGTPAVPKDLIASDGSTVLPPCDLPGATDDLRRIITASPLGQTLHLQVLQVGTVHSQRTTSGRELCTVDLLTTGGPATYQFQYFARGGQVFMYALPSD